MLTKDERTLLENTVEALNRLFDRESTVTDLHALLVATAIGVRGSRLAVAFDPPVRHLRDLIASNASPDRKRDLALDGTDGLRKYVAGELRRDRSENPKRQHALPDSGAGRGDGG